MCIIYMLITYARVVASSLPPPILVRHVFSVFRIFVVFIFFVRRFFYFYGAFSSFFFGFEHDRIYGSVARWQ